MIPLFCFFPSLAAKQKKKETAKAVSFSASQTLLPRTAANKFESFFLTTSASEKIPLRPQTCAPMARALPRTAIPSQKAASPLFRLFSQSREMLLRHLDDHGAQQQQRDEVRDGHEAVERVGDIPHELQVRDRASHNDEAEDDLIGADDLAAKEELRAARAVKRPAEDGRRCKQQQADRKNQRARLVAEDCGKARDRRGNARKVLVAVAAGGSAGARREPSACR